MSLADQILRQKVAITRVVMGEDTDMATNTETLTPEAQAIAAVLGKELQDIKDRLHAIETQRDSA